MQPAFSADGRRLAYASCAKRTVPPCDVHVVNLDTDVRPLGQPLRLTRHRTAIHGIAWTPDGQSLVYGASPFYFSGSGMGSQLWRVSGDGTRPPERIKLPSRTGARRPRARQPVIGWCSRKISHFDILRFVPPEGRHRRGLVGRRLRSELFPRWAAHCLRVVALRRSRRNLARRSRRLDMVQLTGGPVDWRGEPRWRGSPIWSPDGSRIVFASRGDGAPGSVDGRHGRRIAQEAHERSASRRPHDVVARRRWLYYRQDRSDGRDIVRIAATGGVPERITRDGALYPVISPDGKTLFYSKTGRSSPLFAMPIGGVERQIVDCVRPRAITVTTSGLYYLGCGTDRISLSVVTSLLVTHRRWAR